MSEVIVLCPADSVTGGPELLHQFVHELSSNGVDASILYTPYGDHETPDAYVKYNTKTVRYDEVKKKQSVFVFPENSTNLIYDFDSKEKYIWWLSVDNHFKAYPKRTSKKIKFYINRFFRKRKVPIPLSKMKNYKHLTQSDYGLSFLKGLKVNDAFVLTDYLNDAHLNNVVDVVKKQNIVAYNPKKGVVFTKSIIKSNPHIEFFPIQNMTAVQVGELLNRSKVYIDFGEHPGKDRIPREAAMAKCVVITGLRGSAKNKIDVPIDDRYKFDENNDSLYDIGELISDVFDDFDDHCKNFDDYREIIKSEKKVFAEQVKNFIELIE